MALMVTTTMTVDAQIAMADLQQFVASGDGEAFGRVVRQHVDLVYSLCRRELAGNNGDLHLADDATQAVFILLARKARSLRYQRTLVGWLYLTARNCSRSARRAAQRRQRHETEAARRRPDIMQHDDFNATIEQSEMASAVHRAMAHLDAGQRDVLLMRFFQRMTLVEVGRAIGISEDAARQRVNRAINNLRAIMERRREGTTGSGVAACGALPIWLESHAVVAAPAAVARAAMSAHTAAPALLPAAIAKAAAVKSFLLPAKLAAAAVAMVCIGAVALVASVATSQPTTAPSAAGTAAGAPAASQPAAAPVTVTVRALIDGHDHLILKGATAQWRHFEFAAPGRIGGRNEATIINGISWTPQWDDSDMDNEVRVDKSMSDRFEQIRPPIPSAPMTVSIQKVRCRGDATIAQQLSAGNDFTTIVDFDDNNIAGAAWYQVTLTFTPQ
jgi:RNA polymerase sigma factor (sigma-70 family)